MIHAFSGRRREGDFQYFIEVAQKDHPDMTIFTISVDLMVDPIWGNVADEKVRSFWLQAIRQRQVIGALAGPPCETWSQAIEVDRSQTRAAIRGEAHESLETLTVFGGEFP